MGPGPGSGNESQTRAYCDSKILYLLCTALFKIYLHMYINGFSVYLKNIYAYLCFFILCCSFVSHILVVKMIGGLRTFLNDLSQKDLWYKRTFNQKDLLARGPFPKDLLNQRTFGQKDLFSKGPFAKRTF